MSTVKSHLTKSERLCSHYLIDQLFEPGKGSKSLSAYPLRMVYRMINADDHATAMMISVPKRQFRHAVDRNRIKRQLREAYRNNKDLLQLPEGKALTMAFIWLEGKHYPSSIITSKVRNLLQRVTESCAKS